MSYSLLKFGHLLGAVLIGGGLISVWLCDLRSRQIHELRAFSEAVRYVAIFYDGVVVPGAILLLISGSWLIVTHFGGWEFLKTPWLAGMVFLFAFEFIEGNTITRLYFLKLRRLTEKALTAGQFSPDLNQARGEMLPTFTHFLDLPILFLIIALGAIRPDSWALFFVGLIAAVLTATAFTICIPKLYPWGK